MKKERKNDEKPEDEVAVEKAVEAVLIRVHANVTIADVKLEGKIEMTENRVEKLAVTEAGPLDARCWRRFDPMKISTQCIEG